jgi:hypothetical protein
VLVSGLWRAEQNRVVGVRFHVLLKILGSLKRLATEVAFVRLERDVNADMRRDMVAFHSGCPAVSPLAGQVEVVGALSTNVTLTNVILQKGQKFSSSANVAEDREGQKPPKATGKCSKPSARKEINIHKAAQQRRIVRRSLSTGTRADRRLRWTGPWLEWQAAGCLQRVAVAERHYLPEHLLELKSPSSCRPVLLEWTFWLFS